MANEKVILRKGMSSSLPSQIVPGTILMEIDSGNAFLDTSELGRVQLTDTRKLNSSDGKLTGSLNADSNRITNLGSPQDDLDAVSKQYVDSIVQSQVSSEVDSKISEALLGYLPLSGGTLTGSIDMSNNRISNLPSPESESDAVSKQYVDDAIQSQVISEVEGALGNYLRLSGGNMTGSINMSGNKLENVSDPSSDADAANKRYVDSVVSTYLPLSGGTLTGPINAGSNGITNLSDPSDDSDAATKKYVDNVLGSMSGFAVDSNGGSGYASLEALKQAHPEGKYGVFYLVANPDSNTNNTFVEYFWTGSDYELAGGFGEVDTSDLATKQDLSKKADKTIEVNGQPLSANVNITDISGNAGTSTKLQQQRQISITGDANGSAYFDGSDDASINITVTRADKAISDEQGNNIADTYATKDEVQTGLIWGSFTD